MYNSFCFHVGHEWPLNLRSQLIKMWITIKLDIYLFLDCNVTSDFQLLFQFLVLYFPNSNNNIFIFIVVHFYDDFSTVYDSIYLSLIAFSSLNKWETRCGDQWLNTWARSRVTIPCLHTVSNTTARNAALSPWSLLSSSAWFWTVTPWCPIGKSNISYKNK